MDLPALRPIPFCTGMDMPAGRVHVDTGMDARTDNALAYEHPDWPTVSATGVPPTRAGVGTGPGVYVATP